MAQLGAAFNWEDIPESEFEPLPDRTEAMAQVIESEVGPTKAGDGTLVTLTFEIMSGPHEGRRIWERINIRNPNPAAERIGQQALAQLCKAAGVGVISETEPLHHRPVMIRIGIDAGKNGYGDKNKITKYWPVNGGPPAAAPAAARPASQPTAAAKPAPAGGAPWGRRATA